MSEFLNRTATASPRDWRDLSYLEYGTERQKSALAAITKLGVMQALHPYDAVLVSTICLDIDIPQSDLDIICFAPSLLHFEGELRLRFGSLERFAVRTSDSRVVAQFFAHEFEFEIYGTSQPVEQQSAWKHLCQTARVLELGGKEIRDQLRALKLRGVKTEPAVAILLGLSGDPYEAVIQLAELSNEELVGLLGRWRQPDE